MSGVLGALFDGSAGLNAQSDALGVISQNIANVNTVGYKGSIERFETFVSPQAAPRNYQTGGVKDYNRAFVNQQGLIQATQSNGDLAVNGEGFFAVASNIDPVGGTQLTTNAPLVTRKGDFNPDKNGYLQNSAGFYLLGVAVPNGAATVATPTALGALVPIKLSPFDTIPATSTSQVSIAANLPATDTLGSTPHDISVPLIDAAGVSYNATVEFTHGATAGSWSASLISVTDSTGASAGTVAGNPVSLTFDGKGQLTTAAAAANLGTITLNNGTTITPSFNLSGDVANGVGPLTQLDDKFISNNIFTNGHKAGSRIGYQLTSDGYFAESFSNGQSVIKYQVPLVGYVNPDGLTAETGNVYTQSATSGRPFVFGQGTTNTIGTAKGSELEQSNVDLSAEFTNMIIAQRDFSANSRVVTTADQMYSTLTHLAF